jgi:hypothetical protein
MNPTAEGRSVVKPGGRGKHANYKFKINPQQTEYVHDHIHSAPKYKIHYSRGSKTTETYFDCGPSLSSVYKQKCVTWCNTNKVRSVSEDEYRKIFCTKYDMGQKPG